MNYTLSLSLKPLFLFSLSLLLKQERKKESTLRSSPAEASARHPASGRMPPAGLCAMKAGCRYGYSVTTRARAKGNLRARSATKNSRPSRAAIRRITRVRCSVPRVYTYGQRTRTGLYQRYPCRVSWYAVRLLVATLPHVFTRGSPCNER